MITAIKNIWSKEPHYISVELALNRIKNGNSKKLVEEIRNTLDKEKAAELKKIFLVFVLVENLALIEKMSKLYHIVSI